MASFFATFRNRLTSKNPSRDIASTSVANGHSSYSPSVLQRTSTTNSLDEQSLSTEKTCVDAKSKPSIGLSLQQPLKSRTPKHRPRSSQQSRHRHGRGSSRRELSQPVVSFSTPSIPRPPNYRKHSAFARRNDLENAASTGGPCAQAFKAIAQGLNTVFVQPVSVVTQQVSKSCFGGRVTTRRKPAWVARR